MPNGFASNCVVTTVTPLAKCDMASLNCASSIGIGGPPKRGSFQTFDLLRRIWREEDILMRRALTIFAVLALVALSAGAATNDTVRKSFNVGDGGTITLDADIGDIHVTSGGSGSLTIDVVRSARSAEVLKDHELTFDHSGDNVNVRSKFDRDFRGWF